MKVSLNLAQNFSNVDLKSIPRDELLSRIGLQLGAIESVQDIASKYHGIVVVRVVGCVKHEEADKLSLCRIDDGGITANVERGDDGLVQVVCGAPNVHPDMFAAWIPPGIAVPSTLDKDPFFLEAREIRGKVSNGMLASCKELDISDNHDGILEITSEEAGREPRPGEPLADFFGLDDFIIDCENKMFTHRPDCFGNLGVARELAGISGLKYQSPEWYWKIPQFEEVSGLPLTISNDIADKVQRFCVVAMENITVAPSPIWLQASLKHVGIKPINNVVDVTNFIMHLTGQPLHAFDYDKLQKVSDSPSLMPRMAVKGEKLVLLGGKEVALTEEDMVIATDKQAVALAGVMGGAESEVDESTKRIIIECANFDMYTVRRTSMRYGLFTDAATRFTKGQSPLQNDRVLFFTMNLMKEHTGAQQGSNVYDLGSVTEEVYSSQIINGPLLVTSQFINERLGTNLTDDEICSMLQNVEFAAFSNKNSQELEIAAPFWRMDIAIAEDVVEEIGRLYGYDKIPVVLPARSSKPAPRNTTLDFASSVRNALKEMGANEILTYSFVHGDLLRQTGTDPQDTAYHLRNALSPDLQFYRTSVLPSVLAKVHPNIKAQAGQDDNEFALFEIGKAHLKNVLEEDLSNLPKQLRRIALVFAADAKSSKKYSGAAYFQAKRFLDGLSYGQVQYEPLESFDQPLSSVYQKGRAARVLLEEVEIGVIGEFNAKVSKHLKLPGYTSGFELDMDLLQQHLKQASYTRLSAFPSTFQDVTFEVANNMAFGHLERFLNAELAVMAAENDYHFDLRPLDLFQADETDKKRISFRLELSSRRRTLTTDEANNLLEQLAKAAHEDSKAIRI